MLLAAVCGPAFGAPFAADAPVAASGASPFAGCTADNAAGQPGTFYPNSEVETWIEVNPTNPDNIVIGYQQDRWSNGGARGLAASVSRDGGSTWTQVVIPGITACSGGAFQRATDPWLSFSPNGHLYFFSLSLDISVAPDRPGGSGPNAMYVSKSLDGGLTWGAPVPVAADTDPRFLNDKNTITADPGDSRYVYAVWDRLQSSGGAVINPENVIGLGFKGPSMLARTTDGGATWEPARKIYDPGGNNQTIGNQIVVLPDGTLINFFNEILNFKNSDGGTKFDFNFALIRSRDKGATWTRGQAIRGPKIQTMALLRTSGVVDPEDGAAIRTGDLIPQAAVDRDPDSPGGGNLYAVWQDARFGGFQYDEIAFARSTNGGSTWSTPIKINQTPGSVPPGNRQAFTPAVRVGSDGTIAVTYFDFRHNTADPATLWTDAFIVHCHPSAAVDCTSASHWTSETRLTPASFDMRRAPFARGFFIGDYVGLAYDGTRFVPGFVQSGPAPGESDAFVTHAGP